MPPARSAARPVVPRLVPRVKVWLEQDGGYAFGLGLADILQAVGRTGSIKAAAAELGKSYRHVWARIKQAERALGERLVEARVGGEPLAAERTYRVATNSFLAEGGDRYEAFRSGRRVAEDALISDCVIDHLKAAGTISPPPPGRLVPAAELIHR